jgi:type VI secretion system protein VasJ
MSAESMSLEDLRERTRALWAPLPGPTPAGLDPEGAETFATIKREVDKRDPSATEPELEGVTARLPDPQWPIVASLCASMLGSEAKDIRLAAWLAAARAHTSRWQGAAEGLVAVTALAEELWDEAHPRRTKRRANVLSWMLRELQSALDPVPVGSAAQLETVRAALERFDSALRPRLGADYSGIGPLRAVVARAHAGIPTAPAPATASAAPSTDSALAPEPIAPVNVAATPPVRVRLFAPDSASPVALREAVETWGGDLIAIAHALRTHEPESEEPYRLLRCGLWSVVTAPPEVGKRGRTKVSAPISDAVVRLRAASAGPPGVAVVDEIERLAIRYPLWIDPHHVVYTVLERLGLEAAARAVRSETLAFVGRLPSIADAAFASGLAFADGEARRWLSASSSPPIAAQGANQAEGDDPVASALVTARTIASAGHLPRALGDLAKTAARFGDPRFRFRTRLASARLAAEHAQWDPALSILASLYREIDSTLARWEPVLCADVAAELLACAAAAGSAASPRGVEWQEVKDLLFQLDPERALR